MYCQVVSKSELAAGVLGLAGLVLGSVKVVLALESVVKSLGPGSAWEDLNPGSTGASRSGTKNHLGWAQCLDLWMLV